MFVTMNPKCDIFYKPYITLRIVAKYAYKKKYANSNNNATKNTMDLAMSDLARNILLQPMKP
jgi:hypothetical protein